MLLVFVLLLLLVLVLAGMRVRYGWRVVRPHQGSLSREAWFGARLLTRLGKKGEHRTRWDVRFSTSSDKGTFFGGSADKIGVGLFFS